MIRKFAKLIPKDLLDESGSVFYSGSQAWRAATPLYVLGVNPGGSPDSQATETVAWHTDKVIRTEPDNWSASRDESWKGAPPGTWGMQPRVLHMMNSLGLDPGQIPASNLIFVRSQREDAIKSEFEHLAEKCWPFHQEVIETLRPKAILCFGKTAGGYVRARLGGNRLIREFVENNNRRWKSQCFDSDRGIVIVVATHPSIADWTAPTSDPCSLIAKAIESDA